MKRQDQLLVIPVDSVRDGAQQYVSQLQQGDRRLLAADVKLHTNNISIFTYDVSVMSVIVLQHWYDAIEIPFES